MESYEKRYKEALEKLQEALAPKNGCEISGLTRGCIEEIFPEIEKSEDDRIRTAILNHLKKMWGNCKDDICGVHVEDAISWLEKQQSVEEIVERCKKSWYNEGKIAGMAEGLTDDEKYQQGWHDALEKQVPVDKDKVVKGVKRGVATSLINYIDANSKGMCLSNMECEDIEDAIVNGKWYKVYNYMKKKLEKQGDKPQGKTAFEAIKEEKVDNANKVEQKFHEGEWVVWDNKISCHIDNIYQVKESLMYAVTDTNNMIRTYSDKDFDRNAHLWTIKDAKDGDVLISKAKHPFIFKNYDEDTDYVYAYCGITDLVKDNGFYINYEDDELWTMYCVNGDVLPTTKEQRELLFQKMREAGYEWDMDKKGLKKIENNLAWSEEDEQRIKKVMHIISCDGRISNEECKSILDWLESLKDRYTWKPSNIQMECLYDAINHYHTNGYPASKLSELYEQMSKIYKL